MPKKTKTDPHYKKMQRSEKSIEARLKKQIMKDETVEDLEDVIVGLKHRINTLETELKTTKDRLKNAKKGLDLGGNEHEKFSWSVGDVTLSTASDSRQQSFYGIEQTSPQVVSSTVYAGVEIDTSSLVPQTRRGR